MPKQRRNLSWRKIDVLTEIIFWTVSTESMELAKRRSTLHGSNDSHVTTCN